MKSNRSRIVVAIVALVVASPSARALPSFARRESLSCNVCHTNIPRLTRVGYDYRNAGYRFPDALGKPRESAFGEVNAVKLQNDSAWAREEGEGVSERPRGSIAAPSATLYAVTGSFGDRYSAGSEIGLAPEEVEVENAFLRYTLGGERSRWNFRMGVIHPFEGYGASDRPLGTFSPLLRTLPALDRDSGTTTGFAPDFDQAAAEVGYTVGGFNVVATVFNGLLVNEEGEVEGSLGAGRDADDPNYNAKDLQLFANQFFGEAALSAYYYRGTLTTPTETGAALTDRFDRVALYGTLPVLKQLWILGGGQFGWNRAFDAALATVRDDRFVSVGWFAEAYVPWNEFIGASVRYDWLDLSRRSSSDLVQAVTVAANVATLNGAQAILEYQFRDAPAGIPITTTANEVRLRLLYIF